MVAGIHYFPGGWRLDPFVARHCGSNRDLSASRRAPKPVNFDPGSRFLLRKIEEKAGPRIKSGATKLLF
jgi:hypothetical protein